MDRLKKNLFVHHVLFLCSFLLIAAAFAEVVILQDQPMYLTYGLVALVGSVWVTYRMAHHCDEISLKIEYEFAKVVMFGAAYGAGKHRLNVLHDELCMVCTPQDAQQLINQLQDRVVREDAPVILKFGE